MRAVASRPYVVSYVDEAAVARSLHLRDTGGLRLLRELRRRPAEDLHEAVLSGANDDAGTGYTHAGVDLGNEAYALGNVSTVAFVAGAAPLVVGVVLFAAAPSSAPPPSSSGTARTMPPVERSWVGAERR
jgi:hypothetical protein